MDVPDIVGSCCVLHNICQIHGDSCDDSWLDDSFDSDVSTTAHIQSHANTCSADGNIRSINDISSVYTICVCNHYNEVCIV